MCTVRQSARGSADSSSKQLGSLTRLATCRQGWVRGGLHGTAGRACRPSGSRRAALPAASCLSLAPSKSTRARFHPNPALTSKLQRLFRLPIHSHRSPTLAFGPRPFLRPRPACYTPPDCRARLKPASCARRWCCYWRQQCWPPSPSPPSGRVSGTDGAGAGAGAPRAVPLSASRVAVTGVRPVKQSNLSLAAAAHAAVLAPAHLADHDRAAADAVVGDPSPTRALHPLAVDPAARRMLRASAWKRADV